MTEFIHHPNGWIKIEELDMPLAFFNLVEPGYILPGGYIGRLFTQGQVHQLIRVGNSTHDPVDINDAEIAGYVDRKAEYEAAYAAYQADAHVENVAGEIIVSGPPVLSADKTEIATDGVDAVVITCDLEDALSTDEIRWSVVAPDAVVISEDDNAVAGVDTWQLTTSHVGGHTVRVETDNFGSSEIAFQGV